METNWTNWFRKLFLKTSLCFQLSVKLQKLMNQIHKIPFFGFPTEPEEQHYN